MSTRDSHAEPTPAPTVGKTPSGDREPGDAEAGDSVPSGFLPPSEVLGRYVVLHRLGTGGMGIVYAAYDPKLDRKVALKLLRKASADPARRKRAQDRLLAEARAMARLTHPNVITVHDVAVVDGRVVVAMEHVDGDTLSAVLLRGQLGWEAVVELMRKAGRGLVAAHQAGLVHRDFKPDNVMLAKAGRVVVMDFGLAQALDPLAAACASSALMERDAVREPAPEAGEARKPPHAKTRVAGTPAYMAPEQHRGEPVDGRTDQFSFCVTLYEALYGHRPFVGETSRKLRAEIESGVLPDAPAQTRVPAWVRSVVARGLRPDPAARFASMKALLAALAADPAARRRRWLRRGGLASIAGVTGLAGVGLLTSRNEAPAACNGGEARLAGVWDEGRRRDVQARFEATDKPYAQPATTAVLTALDRYAQNWVRVHLDACEATKVRGEQSDELLDLRMQCLGRRLAELEAVTDLLSAADADVVLGATGLVGKMVSVDVCTDGRRLRAPVPLPDDPQLRLQIGDVRELLAAAKANGDAGRPGRGLALASEATERARALGHPLALAEALTQSGRLAADASDYPRAEETLREAIIVAARARDDETSARAWISLLRVAGFLQFDANRVEEIEDAARASLERAGSVPELDAELSSIAGAIALDRGRFEEAQEHFERALERQRRELGDRHPMLARLYNNVAVVHMRRHDIDAARGAFERALEIQTSVSGPNHPLVAAMTLNLAGVLLDRGDTHAAGPMLRTALAVWKSSEDAYPNEIGMVLNNLGYAALLEGKDALAESLFRQALSHWERLGTEHPNAGRALANLGTAVAQQGKHEEALRLLTSAHEIARRTMDEDHSDLAYILTGLGIVQLALGEQAIGTAHLERALEIRKKRPGLPPELPRLRFALAGAVVAQDPERAMALAQTARAGLLALPEEHPMRRTLNDVDAWIAQKQGIGGPVRVGP